MPFIHCGECVGTGRVPCAVCGGEAYDVQLDIPCPYCIDGTEACYNCEGTGGYGIEEPEDLED
jgi:hypothetical protein